MDKLIEELTFNDIKEMLMECISYDGWFEDLDYWEFDEDFFNTFFQNNPMEVCRATIFGNVNWADEYIHFDAYGNLESCNQWEYEQEVKDRAEEIVEHFLELYENNNAYISNGLRIKLINYYDEKGGEENETNNN